MELTPARFTALRALYGRVNTTGTTLRAMLARRKHRMDPVPFVEMMNALERGLLVEGKYGEHVPGKPQERIYRLTHAGHQALRAPR